MFGLTLSLWNQTAAVSGGGSSFSMLSLSPKLFIENDQTKVFSDAGTTQAVDGAAIQQINDKSTSANNFVQATSGLRPIWRVNAGGKPYFEFDGVDDIMATAANAGLRDANGQFWIIATGYFNAILGTAQNLASASIGTGGWAIYHQNGHADGKSYNSTPANVADAASASNDITATTWVSIAMQVTYNASDPTLSTVECWINNSSNGPTTMGASPNTLDSKVNLGASLGGRMTMVAGGQGTTLNDATNRANAFLYAAGTYT